MSGSAQDRRSKYQQIAAELHAAIEAGRYAPGTRLPGENDVMRDYDVSRNTARQALALLVNWGVAEARKGSGVYVRDFRPILREGLRRLSSATWPAGRSVWDGEAEGRNLGIDQIEVQEVPPPGRIRDLLSLAEDATAILRTRRYLIDGRPVMLARSWLPGELAAGTAIAEADTGPGGIYARLHEMGHAPARFREDLRARMLPEPDEAAGRLDLAPGTPVVEITRTAFDAAGRAVEVNEMTADASAYVFRYEFDA
jgi:GntR family transcriptional regulator